MSGRRRLPPNSFNRWKSADKENYKLCNARASRLPLLLATSTSRTSRFVDSWPNWRFKIKIRLTSIYLKRNEAPEGLWDGSQAYQPFVWRAVLVSLCTQTKAVYQYSHLISRDALVNVIKLLASSTWPANPNVNHKTLSSGPNIIKILTLHVPASPDYVVQSDLLLPPQPDAFERIPLGWCQLLSGWRKQKLEKCVIVGSSARRYQQTLNYELLFCYQATQANKNNCPQFLSRKLILSVETCCC